MNFIGKGGDFKDFIDAATINRTIDSVLIEVKKDKLMTSAKVPKGEDIWALCVARCFETHGTGELVISSEAIQRIMKAPSFKVDEVYNFEIGDNELTIRNTDETWETTLDLDGVADHKKPGSSYMPLNKDLKKRYLCPIVTPSKSKLPIPIPREPGTEIAFRQVLSMPAGVIVQKLKDAKAMAISRVVLSTTVKGAQSILLEGDHSRNREVLECELTGKKIDYREAFDRESIEKTLPNDEMTTVFLCMTDQLNNGSHPGLWIGWNRKVDDRLITGGYMISSIGDQ